MFLKVFWALAGKLEWLESTMLAARALSKLKVGSR